MDRIPTSALRPEPPPLVLAAGSEVSIRNRREGGPTPVRRPRGAWRLDGRCQWILTGPSQALAEIVESLGRIGELLGSQAILNFGNSVGHFEIPHLGVVEVFSSKWGTRDFDRMLADVSRVAAQLPFSAGAAGALPYDRALANREPILYHLFSYLRFVLADDEAGEEAIAPALAAILRDPHRRTVKQQRTSLTHRARDVRASELISIVSGARPLVQATGAMAGTPVARALSGRVPERLEESISVSQVDTPENRFVKSFLGLAAAIIDRAEEQLSRGALGLRVRAECALLRRRLEPYRRAGLWSEVGPMSHIPGASTVLQSRRGYKTIYRCHTRLRLGSRLPVDREASRRLLEIRDIAELYELWCYFRLVELVQGHLGPPSRADRPTPSHRSLSVPWDFAVRWRNGARLYYNPRFSRSRAGQRHSYSVPLRPDIALELPEGPAAGLHLLDAKFRLDRLSDLLPSEGPGTAEDGALDAIEREEQRGTFKRADLYKMHAYRDAIPRARSVWVLYPGSEQRFFEAGEERWAGVGAIPLLPGGDGPEVLVELLREGGFKN